MALAKADLHAALDRAASILLEACDAHGLASRRSIRTKLRTLDEAPAALAEALYRFVRRDDTSAQQVARMEIETAVTAAKVVLELADEASAGLSRTEIERLGEAGPIAAPLVLAAKRNALRPPGSPRACAQRLGQLAEGLVFDDYGTEATSVTLSGYASTRPCQNLTPRSVRAILDRHEDTAANALALFEPAEAFLERLPDLQPGVHQRERAITAINELRRSVRDPTAVIVGLDTDGVDPVHPFFVIGLHGSGFVVGLSAHVLWT